MEDKTIARIVIITGTIAIITGAFLFAFHRCGGWDAAEKSSSSKASAEIDHSRQQIMESLPSVADVQKMLSDMGYDVKVDGIAGPQTMAAWNRAMLDREALSVCRELNNGR